MDPDVQLTLSILTLAHFALFVAVALRVLSRPQLNTSTRTAWMFVLLSLPFLGIVAYLLVGEVYFRQGRRSRIDWASKAVQPYIAASGEPRDPEQWGPSSAFATSVNGFGVCLGNRAELLESPEGARRRMIEDMDAATDSINVLYYIWLDDNTGRAVASALIRAAKRGVTCRVIVDALGSRTFTRSQTWKELQAAGVKTAIALSLKNPFRAMMERRLDLRNHRKITVIDGRICHAGSQNCADPEFLPKRKYAPWVDIMVRLEGPVARQMNLLFAENWLLYHDENPALFAAETPVFPDGIPAQVVGTGPTTGRLAAAQLFSRLIFEAQQELIIVTPYFVPGEVVCAALLGAAFSGVNVTLIVPRRNDSQFVSRASRSYYPLLIEAGVTIAEYNGGLLHSKILTIDGRKTFMGSSNMDIRSFDLNFENDVLLHDPKVTQEIRARQLSYLEQSTLVDPEAVRRWPVYKRVWLNLFATMGPLL